jgi:hypothetical protein
MKVLREMIPYDMTISPIPSLQAKRLLAGDRLKGAWRSRRIYLSGLGGTRRSSNSGAWAFFRNEAHLRPLDVENSTHTDAGPLSFFGRLSLCLRGRRYEGNPGDLGYVRGWVV